MLAQLTSQSDFGRESGVFVILKDHAVCVLNWKLRTVRDKCLEGSIQLRGRGHFPVSCEGGKRRDS